VESEAGPSDVEAKKKAGTDEDQDDERIRFTVTAGGRRMSKADFIQTVSRLDPKSRQRLFDESDAPEALKREATSIAASAASSRRGSPRPAVHRVNSGEDVATGPGGLTLVDSNNEDIPFHPVSSTLAQFSMGQETAAQARRRRATEAITEGHEGEDEGPTGAPRGRQRPDISNSPAGLIAGRGGQSYLGEGESAAEKRRRLAALGEGETSTSPSSRPTLRAGQSYFEERETAAEERRRLAALGGGDDDSSSGEEVSGLGFRELGARGAPRRPEQTHQRGQSERSSGPSIRFAEPTSPTAAPAAPGAGGNGNSQAQGEERGHQRTASGMRLKWRADVGQKPSEGSSNAGKKK